MATTAPAPGYPSARYGWYVVMALLVALTISFVDLQIFSLMVQPVRASLGLSDTGIGLLARRGYARYLLIPTTGDLQ